MKEVIHKPFNYQLYTDLLLAKEYQHLFFERTIIIHFDIV